MSKFLLESPKNVPNNAAQKSRFFTPTPRLMKYHRHPYLSCKTEGDSIEVCVLEQIIEVEGEKFEHKTQMVPEDKVTFELDDQRVGIS